MAEVFAGHSIGDHGFQKPVAIKRLLPELANDHVFVERLIGEAKLLVGMQHGNIVSVLDLARDGDDVFLVMEFVDGPSLRQLLKSRGQRGLPLAIATYIVQAAASGLEFAHARPGGAIVHADISPSNLLLTTSGEVRVADFGIARREGGGHGIVEGKWAYMAPEQARGEPLTPRSDVFALGVVLYELVCGAHPFGRQVTAEERDSQPMRVIPPRVVKPSVPHGIDQICMRALAHDPRDRYPRMQALIDALVEERFANGYREGASDLAAAIRECNPNSTAGPRTMITDRPVTIATRSLLKELTPRPRASSSSGSRSVSASASGTPPPMHVDEPAMIPSSGARTNAILTEDVMRAAAMLELPAMLRADGTPMPPFKLSDAITPGQDLASVMGGHTVTGGVAAGVDGRSGVRWMIGVLLVAAVVGAITAYMIAGRSSKPDMPPADLFRTEPAQQPATTPPVVGDDKRDEVKAAARDEVKDEAKPEANDDQDVPKPDDKPAEKIDDPRPETTTANEPPKPVDPVVKTAEPKPSPAPRPRPAIKKETGTLRVQSDPWAWAYIEGYDPVETPGKFTLPAGRYIVKFKNTEIGRSVTKTVIVEAGKTRILTANLEEDD